MKYQEILNDIFKQQVSLVKTDKGLTNDIYLLELQGVEYVVRIPKSDAALIINENHEKEILNIIKQYDIDVHEFYYDPLSRLRITYLEKDVQEYQLSDLKNKEKLVAKLLKTLHSIPCNIEATFDPIETINKYKENTHQHLYDVSIYDYVIEDIINIPHKKCICHNDLVSGNILLSKDKSFLIDYEYAGLNDPLFDLMSFITENNIEDNNIRESFYQEYFDGHIDQETHQHLLYYERFHNLLWLYWAMMMYQNRQSAIYKEIADIKYQALLSSIEKEI